MDLRDWDMHANRIMYHAVQHYPNNTNMMVKGVIVGTSIGFVATYLVHNYETGETTAESTVTSTAEAAANWWTWRAARNQCEASDCTNLIKQEANGRTRRYCSDACKQAAYRERSPHPS